MSIKQCVVTVATSIFSIHAKHYRTVFAYLEVRKTVDGWMNRQTWAKRKSFKI